MLPMSSNIQTINKARSLRSLRLAGSVSVLGSDKGSIASIRGYGKQLYKLNKVAAETWKKRSSKPKYRSKGYKMASPLSPFRDSFDQSLLNFEPKSESFRSYVKTRRIYKISQRIC
jgi:hypothetical protein